MKSEQITTTRALGEHAIHWLKKYILEILSWPPEILAALIGGVFLIIVALIKLFGSDRWERRKTNRLWAALRQVCPHVKIDDDDGSPTVRSLCFRRNGTPWLVCQLCYSKIDENDERNIVERWSTMTPEEAYHGIMKPRKKANLIKEKLDTHDYNWWRKP